MTVTVDGVCAPGFEGVRKEFERNFTERGDVGAAVAATVDGELVVDLWGGHADAEGTRAWQSDTLVNVYSTSKGMTALCAHLLADRGELDIDAPVARYWPEYAQAGKEELPVRWLLSHRAGLIDPSEPMPENALYDWDAVCSALAACAPWWQPGAAQGYHAITFGFLVGEVVRRITGRSRHVPQRGDRRTAGRGRVHRHAGRRAGPLRRHDRPAGPRADRADGA